jgi:hypothetical protein
MAGGGSWEGMNLPQLLEQMHDLVEPERVALWPVTPGWWIVAAWLLAVLGLLGWRARQRWVANRYRREALAQLDAGAARSAAELAALLRRTALAVYPRETVAGLHGDAWARFLVDTAGGDASVAAAAPELVRAPYGGNVDVAPLLAPARRWIELHRA